MPNRHPPRAQQAYPYDDDLAYGGRQDYRDAPPPYRHEPAAEPYNPSPQPGSRQPSSRPAYDGGARPKPSRRMSSDDSDLYRSSRYRDPPRDSPRPHHRPSRPSPSPDDRDNLRYGRDGRAERDARRPPQAGESRRDRPQASRRTSMAAPSPPPAADYAVPRRHRSVSPTPLRRSNTLGAAAAGAGAGAAAAAMRPRVAPGGAAAGAAAARPGIQRAATTTAKGVLQNKRFQKAAMSALKAGGMAAMSARRDPGGWAGQKGFKVATAALGAAAMDAFAQGRQDSKASSSRDDDRRRGGGGRDRERDRAHDRDYDRGYDRGYDSDRAHDRDRRRDRDRGGDRERDRDYDRDRDRDRGGRGGGASKSKNSNLTSMGTALGGILLEQLAKKATSR